MGCLFMVIRQIGVVYLGSSEGVSRDGLPVGHIAPSFQATRLDGQELTFPDLVPGWRVIIFGRSLCPPCQALVPDLNDVAREKGQAATFLFLSQSDPDTTRVFQEESGIRVPVIWTEDRAISESYRVRVSPFAFVIDPEGIVKAKGLANHRQHLEYLWNQANGIGVEPHHQHAMVEVAGLAGGGGQDANS
jgi:peroxiredoxin